MKTAMCCRWKAYATVEAGFKVVNWTKSYVINCVNVVHYVSVSIEHISLKVNFKCFIRSSTVHFVMRWSHTCLAYAVTLVLIFVHRPYLSDILQAYVLFDSRPSDSAGEKKILTF